MMDEDAFRRMGTGERVELVPHIRSVLQKDPNVEILVGTDSQNKADFTTYATAVVLRYQGNGAQVVYTRERVDKITDLWTRLWREVELSIKIASRLSEAAGIPVKRIDMDLNEDPRYGSHRLYSAAVGYVKAHGYETQTKPGLMIASWAANVLCH
jgi:predicted RNase H-related nuclease YkuK (DUF458 family)